MIKILHIQHLPLLYGVQNMMLHLLQSLPRNRFEIYVSSQPGPLLENRCKELGFNYIPITALRHPISVMDIGALHQLIRIIRHHRFDIVHTHSSKTGLLGGIAARLTRTPLAVHTLHGNPFHWGQSRLTYQAFIAIERLIAPLFHKLVFVNNCDRELWQKLGLTPADKAITINNALSDELRLKLVAIASNREMKPVEATLSPGTSWPEVFTIGSTLRFTAQKNTIQTVTTACHICRKHSQVRFVFAGDGEHLDLCRQIVHSLNMTGRVILPGLVSDIPALLATFDVFLLYSNWEAQPISIIEAMYSGLPIIGSDIPPIAELVSDEYRGSLYHPKDAMGKRPYVWTSGAYATDRKCRSAVEKRPYTQHSCGWLVRHDSPTALMDAIARIIQLPYARIREMGNNALERIRHQCSYQAMTEGYLALYDQIGDLR
ncbi:MAG: glycosyltransferase [Candidatus Cloacimonetes bacterium]|nr:glycosyltransferase [Candidatus Cloacimonadota bacterium]